MHRELSLIFRAQMVNRVLGGPFVGPWDVDEIDGPTMDAIRALAYELPAMQKAQGLVRDKFAAWRARHPTYRKGVNH